MTNEIICYVESAIDNWKFNGELKSGEFVFSFVIYIFCGIRLNLPELEILDLAFNSLTTFEFDHFDQVGTLSTLHVNASHNKMIELYDNNNTGYSLGRGEPGTIYHSNIKLLDLSHNNITRISPGFFKPAEISLTHLYLGSNSLTNTTRDVFGSLRHLQWLDLSHNQLIEMDFDTFRNTKNLQVFNVSYNYLSDIPGNLFKTIHDLRIVDLSHNQLRGLPDYLFPDDGMESLDLSHNHLTKIPITSLSNLAALTLCEMDLSYNDISSIQSMDLSNKFRALSSLDLSYNKIFRIDDAAFATLPRLSILDLSHNEELRVMDKAFVGLQNSLIKLYLDNISLSAVPELPLTYLRVLTLSHNELPSIPQELAQNISSLRYLDLSENDFTTVPFLTQLLQQLRSLSLSGNSITTLLNNSFEGLSDTLEHLDISELNLKNLELGTLENFKSLQSLRLSTYPNIPDFNIPEFIDGINSLRELWINSPYQPKQPSQVAEASVGGQPQQKPPATYTTDLHKEMNGLLPPKLKTVVISGSGFVQLADNILDGIQSSSLHIALVDTEISNIQISLFKHLGEVQNISLDVSQNNPKLSKVSNPNTGNIPHMPDKVFLTVLKISGNSLNCDCGIGWIEFWQRRKRQYFCSTQPWSDVIFDSLSRTTDEENLKENCEEIDDDLREAICTNKNNQNLIEILKSDIECGWDSAPRNTDSILTFCILPILLMFWF